VTIRNSILTQKQKKVLTKLTQHQITRVFAYPLKVIISPLKAFKEISQNPDVKGIALILGLVLLATGSIYYAQYSKVFVGVSEREPLLPKLYIFSDAYVYMTTFGNYTFQSSQPYIMNYTFIDETPLIEQSFFWVNTTKPLTPMEPMITVANDTFYQTTVKLYQNATEVGNLTLTTIFHSDTKPGISALLTTTAQWDLGNFTINWFIRSPYTFLANGTTAIDLASKTTFSLLKENVDRAELGNSASHNDWMSSVLIDWSEYGNATLYGGYYTPLTYSGSWLDVVFNLNDAEIDSTTIGLTYSNLIAANLFAGILPQALIQTILAFVLNWVIYAAVLLLVMRLFGEKAGSWRSFFVVVGYAFSIMIIQSAVSALLVATFPEIRLQAASWPPTGQDAVAVAHNFSETWGPTLAYRAFVYLNSPLINFFDIWLVGLGVVIVHAFSETVWRKATTISTTAFILRLFLRLFLGV